MQLSDHTEAGYPLRPPQPLPRQGQGSPFLPLKVNAHKGGGSHAAATAPGGLPAPPHPTSPPWGRRHWPAAALPRSREAKRRRGQRRRKAPRFLRLREPSGQGALPRTPFAGALRWEEKLPSFPRSPTHFNELSGGTPPRRLPRIRPPGSPAPCKEASGGGWTLAAVSAWPGGRA